MSGIIKYKKALYSDCVIKLDLNKLDQKIINTVIFPFNKKEWNEYLDWKKTNPNLESVINEDKEKLLKWNCGLPFIEDGIEIKYDTNGSVIYKKENIECDTDSKKCIGYKYTEYHWNGKVKLQKGVCNLAQSTGKIMYLREYTEVDEINPYKEMYYDDFGTKVEVEYHSKKIQKIRKSTNVDTMSTTTSYYDLEGKLYKQKLVTPIIERITNYFTLSGRHIEGQVGKEKSEIVKNLKETSSYFKEYYPTGKIRVKGSYDENNEMHGQWEWYSRHSKEGQIESIHNFKNGKLLLGSKLFMEDGGLFFENKPQNII